MTRTAMFAAITVISTLATPLVVNASNGPEQKPAEVAALTTAIEAPAATSPAPAPCRRVRVVYSGYSPAAGGAPCAAPQAAR